LALRITHRILTNDSDLPQVRLERQANPISELTNKGVCLSTAGSLNLSYDASEGSVIRELTVKRLEKEGHCGEQPQSLYFVQRLQQALTDPV
jgi:hypothetical protein